MTSRPIEAPVADLPDDLRADVLILPRETAGDVGRYDDSVSTLAKQLRASGATATYLHEADSREWIGEQGIDPIVLSFIVGLASNAGWAGIAALARRTSGGVRAKVARCKETPDGTEWEWFEVEGPGAEVADALQALQPGPGNSDEPSPSDGEEAR
jgi:hypothetical protein